MSLLLAVAYAALAALLLNLGLASRWPLTVKLGAVVVVSVLYVGTYLGLRSMEGWPTTDVLPEHFRLYWVAVDEPVKQTGQEGAIYFWVRELDSNGEPVGPPRAHTVSWDEATAQEVHEAREALEAGRPVDGTFRLGFRDAAEPLFEAEEVALPDLPFKPPA
ncbi:MAG: hypothetical protein VYE73_16910 [Acidobacteriota bacterium]|nr:hypothetical protein [Acidobacteriota bacterium]